jgi:hypothetical protein
LGADFRRPDVLPGPLRACVPASERGIGGGDAHAREPIAAAGGLTIRAHLRYRRPAGRVRVEIVGSQKCRMVGKSQSAVDDDQSHYLHQHLGGTGQLGTGGVTTGVRFLTIRGAPSVVRGPGGSPPSPTGRWPGSARRGSRGAAPACRPSRSAGTAPPRRRRLLARRARDALGTATQCTRGKDSPPPPPPPPVSREGGDFLGLDSPSFGAPLVEPPVPYLQPRYHRHRRHRRAITLRDD